MIDKLRSMAIFAKVAESGSFRRAAETLGLSASVISHHIAQLENQLGARLLYRSTRHVALSDQGKRFYDACRNMLEAASSALDGLHDEQQNVGGRLSVLAPAPFSVGPFVSDVARFCESYPRVALKLDFDDGPHNLIKEGIDVAIRFGAQQDSALVTRTLFEQRPCFYASPAYLEKAGKIDDAQTLQAAQWIMLGQASAPLIRNPQGEQIRLTPNARIVVNNAVAQHEFANAGIGVALLPTVMVAHDLHTGRLVELLPDWQMESERCCVLYPTRAAPQALARLFIDFIHARMQATQPRTLDEERPPAPARPDKDEV